MGVISGGVVIEGARDGYSSPGAPVNGTDEVQRITITGTPTGGGFYLMMAPFETALIARNASAAAVKTALQLLPNIAAAEDAYGDDCVDTGGGALPGSFVTVTFKNGLGKTNIPQMTVRDAFVGGTDPATAITTTTPGVTATARDAATGARLLRLDNGAIYINTGVPGAPTWSAVGTVTVGSVDTADLAANAVDATILEDDAVDTAAVLDGAITAAKLAGALAGSAAGLGMMRVARAEFNPTLTAGERTVAAHDLGVTIPDNAIVCGGFVDVITTFESPTADTATIAISVQTANDIVVAVAIATGTPWDAGLHAIVPKANTPETTGIKMTAARAITATVAVEALTAGKAVIYLFYVPGA